MSATMPPFDATFRELVLHHKERRAFPSDAALAARLNALFPDQERQPFTRQTIGNWTGEHARVPQNIDDLLRLAWAFELNKVQASQLLRAAGKPAVDALL